MYHFVYQYYVVDREYFPVVQWVPDEVRWRDFVKDDGHSYNGEWHAPMASLSDGMEDKMWKAFWEKEVCPCGCGTDFGKADDSGLRRRAKDRWMDWIGHMTFREFVRRVKQLQDIPDNRVVVAETVKVMAKIMPVLVANAWDKLFVEVMSGRMTVEEAELQIYG